MTSPIRMSKKARASAKGLAVCYHTYLEARRSNDNDGVVVWGHMLLEAQQQLGIVMLDADWVIVCVELAKKALAEERAAA